MTKFRFDAVYVNEGHDGMNILTDLETGVQYLELWGNGEAVTPRLNADGSLHIDFEALQEVEETVSS